MVRLKGLSIKGEFGQKSEKSIVTDCNGKQRGEKSEEKTGKIG